jgi:hypothetical protein
MTRRLCWPLAAFRRNESLWLILTKACVFNYLRSAAIDREFRLKPADKFAALPFFSLRDLRCSAHYDLNLLATAAVIDVAYFASAGVDQIVPVRSNFSRWWSWKHLVFCRPCLANGFHSTLFLLRGVESCPLHGGTLIRSCPNCSHSLPYVLAREPRLTLECKECGSTIGEIGDTRRRGSVTEDYSKFEAALRSVRLVCETARSSELFVFSRTYTAPQPAGLAEANVPYHGQRFLRYVCEIHAEEANEAESLFGSKSTHCVVSRPPARRSRQRTRRTDDAVQQEYYRRLARLYFSVRRRMRHRLKSTQRSLNSFLLQPGGVRAEDWTYLLMRAFWENLSVAQLFDSGRDDEFSENAYLAELGSDIHAAARSYFQFLPLTDGSFDCEQITWANLHAWTILHRYLLVRVGHALRTGTKPEQIYTSFGSAFTEDAPFLILRQRSEPPLLELHSWPVPEWIPPECEDTPEAQKGATC